MLLRVALLVALLAAAAAATTADDLLVRTAHLRVDADDAAREPWEHVLNVLADAERTDTAVDGAVHALLAPMLADDIQYIYHGHGECFGLAQVAACLAAEEALRAAQLGGRTRQMSASRQGALHVVRVLESAHVVGGAQTLDVYFVHLGTDGRVRFVEHLPTVHNPIRFTWHGSAGAGGAAVPSA
jgi:hypothetical protein